MNVLLFILALLTVGSPGSPLHKFHVSYSRIAVEGTTIVARVRFFQDDLGVALAAAQGPDQNTTEADEPKDDAFLGYMQSRFVINVGKEDLVGSIIGSGEESEGKEPMRWYLIQYEADSPIREIHITNKLLMESFDDQKNIVQIQHFPSEKSWSLYFVDDALDYSIVFETN